MMLLLACGISTKNGFVKVGNGNFVEYEKYKLIQDCTCISGFYRLNDANDDAPLLPFDLNPKEAD